MPVIPHHHRSVNGVHMFLGANIRPHDPTHPRLSARLDPSRADLTQERNLSAYASPIKDQGALGACTGFSTAELGEMCARIAGVTNGPVLSAGWVYEEERRKEGTFPADDGANTDDGIDIAIQHGIPADSLKPYTAQAATEYDSQQAEADALTHRSIASRLTIDVRDPNVLKLMWVALDSNLPIYIDTYWPEGWFNPNAIGAVPMDFSNIAGGHSVTARAFIPDRNSPGGLGYFLDPNHWSTAWNTQCAGYGHGARVGDFLLPAAAILAPNTPVMHIGVVTPAQAAPQPANDPAAPLKAWLPKADAYYVATGDVNFLSTIGQTCDNWAQYLRGLAAGVLTVRHQPPLPPIPRAA